MTARAKLGAYAGALVAAFALGLGVGAAAGPIDVGADDDTPPATSSAETPPSPLAEHEHGR